MDNRYFKRDESYSKPDLAKIEQADRQNTQSKIADGTFYNSGLTIMYLVSGRKIIT